MRHILARALAALSLTLASLAAVVAPLAAASASAHVPPPAVDGTDGMPAPGNQEEVVAFASEIVINADGTIGVTEHITYNFPESRHGIYRDIPLRYRMDDGRLLEVPIEIASVTIGDGMAVPYEEDRNRNSMRLKIGDPDAMVSGVQEYEITYKASGALRYFEDRDQLLWDVTGNDWEVPIRRVTATVQLPSGISSEADVKTDCFTGDEGSTASECRKGVQGSAAQFAASEPMTVSVEWPPGLVAKLEAKDVGALDRTFRYVPFIFPLIALFGMFRLWNRHGRDPKGRGTLVVEYEAPDKLTPSEIGTLLDESAGHNDISAIIVDLAVRGYLIIRETEKKGLILKEKDYEFELIKDYAGDATLKPFEKRMLEALFAGGKLIKVSDIKRRQTFYKDQKDIGDKVYAGLIADGYYPKNPVTVKGTWAALGIALIVLAMIGGSVLKGIVGDMTGTNAIITLTLSGVIVLCFAPFMFRPTEKGQLAKEKSRGFKEYLEKAEKYRIQWQEKEGIFEKFLPYAMAFGVSSKWASAFQGMQLPPPSWYQGSAVNAGVFNPVLFAGAMTDMNTRAVSAMSSSPSSSGSGGSGGGFGGGGGGSW